MSGFFAGGSPAEIIITNNGWWPDIDARQMASSLRLGDTVSDDRLKAAAIGAVMSVNRELASYQAHQQDIGYTSAESVPGEHIADDSLLIHCYRRAVYCTAGAELAERYRGLDTNGNGQGDADKLTPSIDEYRRDARWAISDILGIGRCTVELI